MGFTANAWGSPGYGGTEGGGGSATDASPVPLALAPDLEGSITYQRTISNQVFIAGTLTPLTFDAIASNALVATLPVGRRPAAEEFILLEGSSGFLSIKIETDGEMRCNAFDGEIGQSFTIYEGTSFTPASA